MKSLLSIVACVLLATKVVQCVDPLYTSAAEVYESFPSQLSAIMQPLSDSNDLSDFNGAVEDISAEVAEYARSYIYNLTSINEPKVQVSINRYAATLENSTTQYPSQYNYDEAITNFTQLYSFTLTNCSGYMLSQPIMRSAIIDGKFISRKTAALVDTITYAQSFNKQFDADVLSIGTQEIYDVIRLFSRISWASATAGYVACLQNTILQASKSYSSLNKIIKAGEEPPSS